ncbi:MAG TPA: tRNA (N(6)-L-threonylcarbamoyladenosine(37)-C(2))-methylthiotransferase MtaB [Beijerinckiaceae bacterium]|nr:tRNA (N(6)-L-threonylcarbamoyladenosine(37)-C(2))-methylthiotransferase MtaB [Beijerinckiaceae bacterium]
MSQHGSVETITFGCRLNGVESDAMREAAEAAGARGLVIVNTCAVTAESVRQARQAIRRIKRERPDARIAVTGCAAQIEPARFAAMPEVDRLIANARKADPATWGAPGAATHAPRSPARAHTRSFVEIQNGCDHRCTFCVIPFGRGESRSRSVDDVIETIDRHVAGGSQEVVLTGVDLTSWGGDLPGAPKLGSLVRDILRRAPKLARLRLSSLDCGEFDTALWSALAEERRLMPHLHLSLQSGSDLILKRMKRRHSRAESIRMCEKARDLRPEIAIGADFIVGFPTETEAMFQDSLRLVDACGLNFLHVFPYSARPGTPAARMPQVPRAIVKERAARLREKGEAALAQHLSAQIGRRLRVLAEKGGRGHAEDFSSVLLRESVPAGEIVDVLIAGIEGRDLLVSMGSELGLTERFKRA